MKKNYMAALCFLFFLISSISVFAMEESTVQPFSEEAMELVKIHMESLDTDSESVYYENATDNVNTYLHSKENSSTKNLKKYNYELETSIADYKITDDVTYIKVNVIASWNYTEGIDSGYGKNIDVLIDNSTGQIIDVYDEFDSFDVTTRGEKLNILNIENRLTSDEANKAAEIYSDKISENAIAIEETIINEKTNTITFPRTLKSNYSWIDHDAVVTWAKNNCSKNQPNSGNGTVPYTIFLQ